MRVWRRQRSVRICDQCGAVLPDASISRDTAAQGGSIAGSLAFSMGTHPDFACSALVSDSAGVGRINVSAGASEVLGAALGPVGAITGAIGGAIAGSRLGAQAVGGIYSVVESHRSVLCEPCEAAEPGFVQRLSEGAASSAASAAAVAGCASDLTDLTGR